MGKRLSNSGVTIDYDESTFADVGSEEECNDYLDGYAARKSNEADEYCYYGILRLNRNVS